jgi:HEAT repeat protein
LLSYLVQHLDRARHTAVYVAAVHALGLFDTPESVDALRGALSRGDWWAPSRTRRIRSAAATSLKRIGTAAALDVLRMMSSRGSRGARAAARGALADAS